MRCRLAGVSVATTSKVINKKSSVRPKLVQRVVRAMEALDYHPDQVARSLTVGETRTIGIVVPDVTNPLFTDVIRGIENEGLPKEKGAPILPPRQTNRFGADPSICAASIAGLASAKAECAPHGFWIKPGRGNGSRGAHTQSQTWKDRERRAVADGRDCERELYPMASLLITADDQVPGKHIALLSILMGRMV